MDFEFFVWEFFINAVNALYFAMRYACKFLFDTSKSECWSAKIEVQSDKKHVHQFVIGELGVKYDCTYNAKFYKSGYFCGPKWSAPTSRNVSHEYQVADIGFTQNEVDVTDALDRQTHLIPQLTNLLQQRNTNALAIRDSLRTLIEEDAVANIGGCKKITEWHHPLVIE